MCTVHCCGVIFGLITCAILAASLAVPWYYVRLDKDMSNCQRTQMVGWFRAYCTSSGGGVCDCPHSDYNWRDSGYNKQEVVYNVSFSLTLVAAVFAFILLQIFAVYCCCPVSGANVVLTRFSFILFGGIGLALLTASFIYYAVQLPKAIDADGGTPGLICGGNVGPCNNFADRMDLVGGSLRWGPAGWIGAVVAWPFFLTMIMLGLFLGR